VSNLSLIVGFAQSKHKARREAYDRCLYLNSCNREISRIILLVEEPGLRPLGQLHSRVKKTINLGRRSTFQDYVDAANQEEGVCVFCNADITFDWSVQKLKTIPPGVLCAITRADFYWNLYSSDAWAFRPPMPVSGCNWSLGRSGCENAFCRAVQKQLGWQLWNPWLDIRLGHDHDPHLESDDHDHAVKTDHFPFPEVVRFNRRSGSHPNVDFWSSGACRD